MGAQPSYEELLHEVEQKLGQLFGGDVIEDTVEEVALAMSNHTKMYSKSHYLSRLYLHIDRDEGGDIVHWRDAMKWPPDLAERIVGVIERERKKRMEGT